MGVAAQEGSTSRCLNCGSALHGHYCSACGQRDLPVDPSLRELLAEAWDTFVSVDGKALGSLKLLLLRPGALTREYLVGRRASFIPPLRLYLVCSVVYFIVSAALPDSKPKSLATATPRAQRDSIQRAAIKDSTRRATLESIGHAAPAGPLDSASRALADSVRLERSIIRATGEHPGWFKRVVFERFMRNGNRISRDNKNFTRDIQDQVPRIMFVLMPLFAAMLALAYRSRRRRYPTHLIVSLHVHAFGFAALTIGALISALPESTFRSVGIAAVALWMFAYVPLAFRGVYGGRLRRAVLRSLVLEFLYGIIGVIAFAIGALVLVAVY